MLGLTAWLATFLAPVSLKRKERERETVEEDSGYLMNYRAKTEEEEEEEGA